MIPATELSRSLEVVQEVRVPWCLEFGRVVQEGLVPWYLGIIREYSALSKKEGKVYRGAEGG